MKYQEALKKAKEELKIKKTQDEIKNLIRAWAKDKVQVNRFIEQDNYPFFSEIEIEKDEIGWLLRYLPIAVDIEGNHPTSFFTKNRFGLSNLHLKAAEIWCTSMSLIEVEETNEEDDTHSHYLYTYVGDIEGDIGGDIGKKIYLLLAKVDYHTDD